MLAQTYLFFLPDVLRPCGPRDLFIVHLASRAPGNSMTESTALAPGNGVDIEGRVPHATGFGS